MSALTVSTINVNGIRAAIKQRSETNLGLVQWLSATTADVVCLQETRADDEQLTAALQPLPVGDARIGCACGRRAGRARRRLCVALVRPRSGDCRLPLSPIGIAP